MESSLRHGKDVRELRGLVERIKRGDCVLVLGPRVAFQPEDPDRRPLVDLLTCDLLSKIDASSDKNPTASCSFHSAADIYYRNLQDREELELAVQDFYRENANSTTDFHRDLACLPFKLCVSTSPDSLMLNAFTEEGKLPQMGHYSYRTPTDLHLKEFRPENPFVYFLFGHHEDPNSLVLTDCDLIDFIVAIIKGNPKIHDQVRSVLADPATSFLFVGFGFHRWYLRVLLHVMDIYDHRSKAIAFEDANFFDHPDHEQTVGFFSGKRLIQFRPLRWNHFSKQLLEVYEASTSTSQMVGVTSTNPLPDSAPQAFISYASEDLMMAERLKIELKTRGIRVWQDKQDLRAGDDWNRTLLDVIKNRVNYVVVLQTEAMTTAIQGVFHREIAAASEKQAEMGEVDGIRLRFLIPIKFGACRLLSSLKELHIIDVGTPSGFDQLALSIHEDWKRRKKLNPRRRMSA